MSGQRGDELSQLSNALVLANARAKALEARVDMLRIALIGACGTLGTAVDMGVPNASTMRDALRALYLDTGGPIE